MGNGINIDLSHQTVNFDSFLARRHHLGDDIGICKNPLVSIGSGTCKCAGGQNQVVAGHLDLWVLNNAVYLGFQ